MRKKAGITRKTFLFAALLIVLVTLVSFAILYFAMPSYYLHKKEQGLQHGATELREALLEAADKDTSAALITTFAEDYNVIVMTFDKSGVPIFELCSPFTSLQNSGVAYEDYKVNGEPVGEEQFHTMITQIYEVTGSDGDSGVKIETDDNMSAYIMLDIGSEILLEAEVGSELIHRLQIQGTLQPIEEARGVILSLIPYVLAAGTAIGLCLAWIYARQITKPILQLSDAAERMKRMEPDAVSGLRTDDELGQLSENMDALYQSLSDTIGNLKTEMAKVNRLERSKTEMMQSASHELKTPIAALGGMLDGMIDNIGVYKDKDKYLLKCREQVEKLSFLVKEILEASKADNRTQTREPADVQVDEMIDHILAEQEYQIKEKNLVIETDIEAVMIRTEAADFYRVVANLIGNAVRYTPELGAIRIRLCAGQLELNNECDPIPEEELSKLFEPFYTRSDSRDKSESGTGLGLYIVKRNLERLSIPYQVASGPEGFRITIRLHDASYRSGYVPAADTQTETSDRFG